MLLIIDTPVNLPFDNLMRIYEQSNRERGLRLYFDNDSAAQLLLAEQDLYEYLCDVLTDHTAVLALWSVQDHCVSALRLEVYLDGLLLTALETAPEDRQKGYGESLVRSVLKAFPGRKIYSHIHCNNVVSIDLHQKCGFQKIADNAQFLDGSRSSNAYTYLIQT